MPSATFLWDYTPRFQPFSPVFNERAMVGQATDSAAGGGRSTLFQYWGDWHQPFRLDSNYQGMFGRDFYERFHVSALVFALGNLVGNQTRELRVWNAYRRARVLQALDLIDGEGILISGQPNPPLQFAPLQERVYNLEITTEGPPTVEASLVFDLDEGQSITVLITGSRVTPWPWVPDWGDGVSETLEWLTDITESENDNEQATAMRLDPRRSLEFRVGSQGQARQQMATAVTGWAGRVWSLPVWPDEQVIGAPLTAGSLTIPADTAGRDFYVGGLAMFLGQTSRDFEVVEIQSLTAGTLELKRPTVRAWPSGTSLFPARTARLDGGGSFNAFTGQMQTGRMRFDMVGPCEWPELTGLPMYRGLPVLEDMPEWSQEPSLAISRKLSILDNRFGRPEYTDRADVPLLRQAHRWSPVGRARLARLRSLLYLLKGKWGAIWVPSWIEDFSLAAPAVETGSALDIDWQGYTLYLNAVRNRRDVRISDGSAVQYARIASATELDANTERLGLDQPLTHTFNPIDTTVQYLTLWRLDTDRLEWAWWSGDMGSDQAHADVPMPMRTFRHDL